MSIQTLPKRTLQDSLTEVEPDILVEHVYKRYSRNEKAQRSLRHEAASIFKQWVRRHRQPETKPFYALHDLNFSIRRGESVAIIGRNGSGKTTLLRILAGITRPTGGRVLVKGRSAALIALGAGFKPDLTGRKNIYLNAAINSVHPREIDPILDDIIAFSELGDFIDIPITRYSSGMIARLGFSIAVHILPDIIFIDEVLSVGDAAFQVKCMERITELWNSNRTIVFVSHSEGAVRSLCERSVWLHQGKLMMDGPTADVYTEYNDFLQSQGGMEVT